MIQSHVYHQYTVRILNGKRDELQKYLKDKGITTMVYYPVPLHKMKVFINRYAQIENLKTSENIVKEIVSLPIDPLYNKSHIEYVLEIYQNSFF